MKLPDCLQVSSAETLDQPSFSIGETGFSFGSRQRPVRVLSQWFEGDAIPPRARAVLGAYGAFSDLVGLVRAPTEADAEGDFHAEWMLARASTGLLSIVIRDAALCDASHLADDMRVAVEQARRYCATSAVVVVQERRESDAHACCEALEQAFATQPVHSDFLYRAEIETDVPAWFASLSP